MKTKIYQIVIATLLLSSITLCSYSQTFSRKLPHFDKIIVNPHINLTLEQDKNETIEITSKNVDSNKIIIKVNHGNLKIYLEDWNKYEKIREGNKRKKRDRYENAIVNVNVTFSQLTALVVKGEEQVKCQGNIENELFRLRAYGEAKLFLQHVEATHLKIKLYGENKLAIQSGEVTRCKSKLYGENKIDLANVPSQTTLCSAFGESKFTCNSGDRFRVCSFGESKFTQYGKAKIRRIIALGENQYLYASNQN